MKITIIGSGAIGGTLGAHMIRAGHDITLCDADAAHVAAIRSHGLIIEGPVNEFTVATHAITPDELPDQIEHAIVAVKSLHTRDAAELLRGRLAPDGYVLTVQNGLTADTLIEAVGRDRVISAFVNFGADVMAPGRIMQGNVATFRVGELDGGRVTPRVLDLVDALPYAKPTDNVLGFLWGKEAYGAMLWAGAVSDLTIAEHLEDPRYRPVMIAIAREVLAQAPVKVESFDGFDPNDLEGSLDRLAEFNRDSAKKYSGIYRDLVVRKRKTEIDEMLRDVNGPVFSKVAEIIHDIEEGRRVNERANLDELAEFVAALPTAVKNLELPRLDSVLTSLGDYVAIPSDSRNADRDTMRRAADWIAGQLDFAGGHVEETGGHPVVRGEWLGPLGAPTVLVYGHYDVQPTGDESEWLSPPFRLTVDGDIARGRGVSDDKGPVFLVVAMLQAAIAQRGGLPLNVKFLIEGEEEIGSPHLPGYVREHARELACDLVISADGAQWRPDEPSLSVASKGLVAFTITVEGARDDLHSGRYGGVVANPVHVLSAILASLHNPDGSVAVPGFYDGVTPPSAERLAQLDAVPFDDELFAAQIGIPETYGEAVYSTLQRLWERPTLEVNGVAGGGRYTVIPHVARGFISCRLVGDQNPRRVLAAVRGHVERLDTRGVRVTVEQDGGAVPAYRIDPAHPAIAAATEALRAVYPDQEVLRAVIAGTLPATTLFEQVLGAKTLFFSFSTADEKLHAPNEFLRLRRIHEGMRAWDALLTSMADGPHRLRPVNVPELGETRA